MCGFIIMNKFQLFLAKKQLYKVSVRLTIMPFTGDGFDGDSHAGRKLISICVARG